MSIETDFKSELDNYAGLSALVSDRNYVNLLPQKPTYPNTVINYFRMPVQNLSGESNLKHYEVQIDVRAATYSVTRDVALQVIDALKAATVFKARFLSDDDMVFEEAVDTHRAVLRFSVWQ